MHRDHVPTVLPGFELLGSTDVCHNQGMVRYTPDASGKLAKLSDIQILTLQGHPEFTKSILSKVIGIRAGRGIFTPEFAQDAIKRNELRNDGVEVIARTIWRILGANHAEN
jgi:GMP synthase-like glutamine amidotransferase